jgi:hypothetical protein
MVRWLPTRRDRENIAWDRPRISVAKGSNSAGRKAPPTGKKRAPPASKETDHKRGNRVITTTAIITSEVAAARSKAISLRNVILNGMMPGPGRNLRRNSEAREWIAAHTISGRWRRGSRTSVTSPCRRSDAAKWDRSKGLEIENVLITSGVALSRTAVARLNPDPAISDRATRRRSRPHHTALDLLRIVAAEIGRPCAIAHPARSRARDSSGTAHLLKTITASLVAGVIAVR